MTERLALQHAFPRVTLQLFLFHVLRSFDREVTTTAMTIRPVERYLVLDIFKKMAYVTSQDTYEQLRQQLHETGLHRVVSYFETNWHVIQPVFPKQVVLREKWHFSLLVKIAKLKYFPLLLWQPPL